MKELKNTSPADGPGLEENQKPSGETKIKFSMKIGKFRLLKIELERSTYALIWVIFSILSVTILDLNILYRKTASPFEIIDIVTCISAIISTVIVIYYTVEYYKIRKYYNILMLKNMFIVAYVDALNNSTFNPNREITDD